jgi:hypothetical protein
VGRERRRRCLSGQREANERVGEEKDGGEESVEEKEEPAL